MALLQVVQYFCGRVNIPSPASVTVSTDPQIKQVMRILEEEGNDLASRHSWQSLTIEASHTSLAQDDQGAITALATNGFRYIKNGTIWDRTDQTKIIGPLSDQEWQSAKAMAPTGPDYRFRIRGNKLLIIPVPTAGHAWYFEYVSKNWILGADGTSYKQYFTLDTDTIILPEELVLAGLKWRWKKEKGFDYAEDMRTYEIQVKDAMGRDGGRKTLDMNGCPGDAMPGVFVPQGSWSVP
jgi:hypothetical protein